MLTTFDQLQIATCARIGDNAILDGDMMLGNHEEVPSVENVGFQSPPLYQRSLFNSSLSKLQVPQNPSVCAVFSRNLFAEPGAKPAETHSRALIFSKPVCYAI